MAALVSKSQFENRLGREVVARIYDDNNDGEADSDPILQLLDDASDYVRGAIGGAYDLDLVTSLSAATAGELRRLTLDAAMAMAAQRHSGYIRYDWEKILKRVDEELYAIRLGKRTLGSKTAPEPRKHPQPMIYTKPSRGWSED
ncbi:MAG: hypothetical protein H0U64_02015 [Gemmatimonadaceae bacterium]|nr:hypothetical protein [Gemmatimonadaceae bacterium]